MVSLANGNTDVLSNATADSAKVKSNDKDVHKEQENVIFDRRIRLSGGYNTKMGVTDPSSVLVTNKSSKIESTVAQNSLVEMNVTASDKTENVSQTIDNGVYNSSSDPLVSDESQINGRKSPTELEANTSVSSVSAPHVSKLVYVGIGSLQNVGKGDNIKRKLSLVNNNSAMKGTNVSAEVLVKDDANTAVTSNTNDTIGKKNAVSSNAEVPLLESTHGFVQLSESNMKNIKLNVTPTSTNSIILKPNQQPYEILRAKLMENRLENPEPTLLEIPSMRYKPKTMLQTLMSAPQAYASKYGNESLAIIEARNELMKCRKKLVQAAVNPIMPAKVPPSGYDGPTFSCEECQDTFISEDSLKSHRDRRSVLFTYACPSCKKTLEFYNRCMFLIHVRSHNSSIKPSCLTISTIPSSKLKFAVLEGNEESATTNDEDQVLPQTRSKFASGILVSVNPKPATQLAEKTSESQPSSVRKISESQSSSVRILKSSKKRKQPSVAKIVEDRNDDDVSPLKSLLVGERKLSQAKSQVESSKSDTALPQTKLPASNGKKSSEGVTDDDDQLPPMKSRTPKPKKMKAENIVKSKIVSKQPPLSASVEQKTNDPPAPEVTTVSGVKRNEQQVKTPATTNNHVVEEIILSASDEEEEDESLPDSNNERRLVMCRDCKKEVPHLPEHYIGDHRPKREYPCEKCQYFNASACASSAHIRMHSQTQPFVCPDCGYFFSTLETFLHHVKEVCFYDFKAIRFKCPECSVLKASATKFKEHLRSDHVREAFKCTACISSAYTSIAVEKHIAKMHPNPDEPVSVLGGYWCKLCPNMLVSKQLLEQHINNHVCSLKYLQYVYICKICNNYASLRRSKFANHYRTVCSPLAEATFMVSPAKKPNRNRLRKRSAKRKLIPSKANSSEAASATKEPSSEQYCGTDSSKKDVEIAENVCVMCRQTEVSKPSSPFCRQCVCIVDAEDASPVTEPASKDGSSRIRRKFKCKHCKECMNRDWSTITKHFELYHHSDLDVRANMRSSSSDQSAQSVAANRKRKLMMKVQENTKLLKADSKYRCVKCSIVTNDRKQFHDHIVTHKAQSDFQCLECGLCFIVRTSLEKHLIVEHKIRQGDLKEYFKTNGIEAVEEKVEERTLKENQCEVCYFQCESKQNYDKHIRTHGMAFVAMQSKAKI